MRTLKQIQKTANNLYNEFLGNQLEIGTFFKSYHDLFLGIVDEINTLEEDELDYATKLLLQCNAIIEAQNILSNQNIY